MSFLGIDVGTSGCKASVVDPDGKILGSGYQEYAAQRTEQGWEELDPQMIWLAVQAVIAKSLSSSGVGASIQAISVSSFGETVVPIDRDGEILGPGILYYDQRGVSEAGELADRLGQKNILEITGVGSHPMYSISKIMWIKKHQPQLFAKTWKFLFFADLILFRLGAAPATGYSMAARSMAFDVVNKCWSNRMLDAAGLAYDLFAAVHPAGSVIGQISPAQAQHLGINTHAVLVTGGHDQTCAALGAGAIREGIAVNGMGTVDCLTPCFSRPIINEQMAASSFACVPHVVKDRYVTYAFNFTSGSLLRWYRDNFGAALLAAAKKRAIDPYQVMIEQALVGPSGLYVLPHFAGAATPYMDNQAVGAIVGLGLDSTPARLIKALLEGINFEMMLNHARLAEAGVSISELRVTGGLARSETMLQLRADMMGLQVSSLEVSEAGILGVAILAGTACGEYRSIDEGVERLVRVGRSYTPNRQNHADYQDHFLRYQRLYPAVREIYGR